VTTKLTGLATPDLEQRAVIRTSLMSRSFSSLLDASVKFPGISFTWATNDITHTFQFSSSHYCFGIKPSYSLICITKISISAKEMELITKAAGTVLGSI